MTHKPRLELTWIGKYDEPRLEPRILIEEPDKSYGARSTGNMLIHGDNLLALKALEQDYVGKVKCIYIDPPYNTGSAFEHYDDGLEHSIWLSMMQARLKLLRKLLSEDGSIWITIDDNEAHYLKVLCDEVFGRANFVANMIWEKRTSRENRRVFSFNHDHVLVYARNKTEFESVRNPLQLNDAVLARYRNPDNDARGPWQSVSANAQAGHATPSQFYKLELPSGREIDPPKGRCWLYTKNRMAEEIAAGNIWFGVDGNNAPRVKKFLRDSESGGLTPETIWPAREVGTNDDAKKGLLQLLLDVPVFDNPKPETLIQRILHIATNPGDLVLDSFLGSGTTAAVAHKMGRRWIGIELGDHCYTHCLPRLKKVVDGSDQGGISKAVEWKGGGGFRTYRLAPSLLKKDEFDHWIINPEYNAEMLAAAVCKHEGFHYEPDTSIYWKQGRSTEKDYIFVTTMLVAPDLVDRIHDQLAPGESVLICCKSYRQGVERLHSEIQVKKIPLMLFGRCEFGKEDYSLNILPVPHDETSAEDSGEVEDATLSDSETSAPVTAKKPANGQRGRRTKPSLSIEVNQAALPGLEGNGKRRKLS